MGIFKSRNNITEYEVKLGDLLASYWRQILIQFDETGHKLSAEHMEKKTIKEPTKAPTWAFSTARTI